MHGRHPRFRPRDLGLGDLQGVGLGALAAWCFASGLLWAALCGRVTGVPDGYLKTQEAWRGVASVTPFYGWTYVPQFWFHDWAIPVVVAGFALVVATLVVPAAWRLGNEMLVIGMGAETVVDYALRFKTEFGPGTWVCGYADDMISYIPSRRVWDEGGYEGGSNLYEYGRPALRWADDIETRIAAGVQRLVKEVKE